MATRKLIKEDLVSKQSRLAHEMKIKIAESGLSSAAFFAKHGITPAEGSGITLGRRSFAHSNRGLVERICSALGQTPLTFYLWAGVLEPADLLAEEDLIEALDLVLRMMTGDKRYAFLAPSKSIWSKTPLPSKIAIAMMYQSLSNKKLLNIAKVDVHPQPIKAGVRKTKRGSVTR